MYRESDSDASGSFLDHIGHRIGFNSIYIHLYSHKMMMSRFKQLHEQTAQDKSEAALNETVWK